MASTIRINIEDALSNFNNPDYSLLDASLGFLNYIIGSGKYTLGKDQPRKIKDDLTRRNVTYPKILNDVLDNVLVLTNGLFPVTHKKLIWIQH